MFMTRQPYVPLGSLRAALTYPSPETTYRDENLVTVLQSAGLDRIRQSNAPSGSGVVHVVC
jgi:ABC-type uncharacterized transport system fused permease/ATPase subunit